MNWRTLITTTLELYQQVASDTWKKVQHNWWIAFLPLVYGLIFLVAGIIAAPLGILGGFLLGFVLALCTSSYLYFIAGVVAGTRMTFTDLSDSWRPCLSPVITILFFFFVVQFTLSVILPGTAGAEIIALLINLGLLIALNPIPEIVYQGRSDGFDMLQESIDFLRENGIEWFIPLIVISLLSFVVPLPFMSVVFQSGNLSAPTFGSNELLFGSVTGVLLAIISAVLFYLLMVFRGLLFRALSGSTRRQRLYRARFS
jgi:membrane protease YdiL (CAAX protease family)